MLLSFSFSATFHCSRKCNS